MINFTITIKPPEQPPSIDGIAERAARINVRHDYQVAQNDAYREALRQGFSQVDADECAKLAGSLHEEYAYQFSE
jgi:hypothetical protein